MPAINCTRAEKQRNSQWLICIKEARSRLSKNSLAQNVTEGMMSPGELAVLILILAAFGAFMATLAWASRQSHTTVKVAKRVVHRGALRPQRG